METLADVVQLDLVPLVACRSSEEAAQAPGRLKRDELDAVPVPESLYLLSR